MADEGDHPRVVEPGEASHGARHQLLEARVVGRDRLRAVLPRHAVLPARHRVRLVPAEEHAAALGLAVHEVVGVAKAWRVARQLVPLHRVQRDVLVVDGYRAREHAHHLRDAWRPHTRGIHDRLALDRPVVRLHGDHATVVDVDAGEERARANIDAELARRTCDRIRRDVRVDVAVAGHPHGAVERFRGDLREVPSRLLRPDELRVEPDRVRTTDSTPQLEEALLTRCDAQRPHTLEDAQLLVQLHAVAAEAHHRRRRVELRDEPGGVMGRAARQLALLDEDDVADARLGEVVRTADPGDPSADDDDLRHARTRSPFGSYKGSARISPPTQSPKMSTATVVPTAACSTGTYAKTMLAPTA